MSNPQETNSSLKNQITEDMKSSMKSGDKKKLAAIKLILAAIINKEDVRGIRNIDRMSVLIPEAFDNIDEELNAYGESLRQRLGLPVAEYDASQSKFFKFCHSDHRNRGVQDREIK